MVTQLINWNLKLRKKRYQYQYHPQCQDTFYLSGQSVSSLDTCPCKYMLPGVKAEVLSSRRSSSTLLVNVLLPCGSLLLLEQSYNVAPNYYLRYKRLHLFDHSSRGLTRWCFSVSVIPLKWHRRAHAGLSVWTIHVVQNESSSSLV